MQVTRGDCSEVANGLELESSFKVTNECYQCKFPS